MNKFFALMLLLSPAAHAQTVTSGTTLPATCTFGDVFNKTAAPFVGSFNCLGTNSWTFVGRNAADALDPSKAMIGDTSWGTMPGNWQVLRKSADQSEGGTSPVNLTDLSWSLPANGTQSFACMIFSTNTLTAQAGVSVTGSSSVAAVKYGATGSIGLIATVLGTAIALTGGTGSTEVFAGTITNNGTPNTVQLKIQRSGLAGTTTVSSLSFCLVF